MASKYPAELDDFENPDPGSRKNVLRHSEQHGDNNDATEALQRKVGVGESDASEAAEGSALRKKADGTTGWEPVEDTATAQQRVEGHANTTENVHGIADTGLLETQVGAQAKVNTHDEATLDVHGIADTAALETAAGAQEKSDAAAGAVAANLVTHTEDAGAHGATPVFDPEAPVDSIVRRDEGGQAQFGEPVQGSHAATKGYVDGLIDDLVTRVEELESGSP